MNQLQSVSARVRSFGPGLSGVGSGWLRAPLVGLVLLWGVTRLAGLASNPRYYSDECTYAAAAERLARGESRFGAVRWPFARECLAKPPLWFLLDVPFQWLPGPVMFKARLPSALVSLGLLWVLVRLGVRLHSAEAGWVAAWVSLVHAPALLFFRWAMPYNLAGLLNALAVLALVRGRAESNAGEIASGRASDSEGGIGDAGPSRGRLLPRVPRSEGGWLLAAGTLAGLSAASEFFSFQAAGFVWVWTLLRRRFRTFPGVVILSLLPSLVFAAWGGWVRGAGFFREWASLLLQFGGAGGGTGIGAAASQMTRAMWITWTHDAVYLVGIPALAIWTWRGRGLPVALFFLFMLPLTLRRQGADPSVPFNMTSHAFALHLGFAAALCEGGRWLARRCESVAGRRSRVCGLTGAGLALLAPVVMTGFAVVHSIRDVPLEEKALGSVRSVADTRDVSAWINSELAAGELAIVPERLVVFVRCRAAPVNQALFAAGYDAVWMRHVRREDLAFDPSLDRARVAVLDAWDRINGIVPEDPGCGHPFARLLREGRWRHALQIGEYSVFLPPREER